MIALPAFAGLSHSRYGVIIADPPWSYDNTGCRGVAENYYSTMNLEQLCNLQVDTLALNDSVLLLWCTWPQMREGLQVMDSWGFKYITGFPWVKVTQPPKVNLWDEVVIKPQYGVGFWARGCTEFVMIGKRGSVSPPTNGFIGLLSENYGHSRKPDNLHHYAEALPGPYLELFGRRSRIGWDVWGNQVDQKVVNLKTVDLKPLGDLPLFKSAAGE